MTGPLEPEAWPAPEPCPECGGRGRSMQTVRRTSRDAPREVEAACPICTMEAPAPTPMIAHAGLGRLP